MTLIRKEGQPIPEARREISRAQRFLRYAGAGLSMLTLNAACIGPLAPSPNPEGTKTAYFSKYNVDDATYKSDLAQNLASRRKEQPSPNDAINDEARKRLGQKTSAPPAQPHNLPPEIFDEEVKKVEAARKAKPGNFEYPDIFNDEARRILDAEAQAKAKAPEKQTEPAKPAAAKPAEKPTEVPKPAEAPKPAEKPAAPAAPKPAEPAKPEPKPEAKPVAAPAAPAKPAEPVSGTVNVKSPEFQEALREEVAKILAENRAKLRATEGLWQSQDEFAIPLEKPIGNAKMFTKFETWFGERDQVYHVLVEPGKVVRIMPIETVRQEFKGTNVMWVGAEWEVDADRNLMVASVNRGVEEVIKRDNLEDSPPKRIWVGDITNMPEGFTNVLPKGWYAQTFDGGFLPEYPYPPFMLKWVDKAKQTDIQANSGFTLKLEPGFAATLEYWDGVNVGSSKFVTVGAGKTLTIPGKVRGNFRKIREVTDDRMLIVRAREMAIDMARYSTKRPSVPNVWAGSGDVPEGFVGLPAGWEAK